MGTPGCYKDKDSDEDATKKTKIARHHGHKSTNISLQDESS